MNVQELIDKLQLVEDKTLPVCIEDWNEGYAFDMEFNSIKITKERYIKPDSPDLRQPIHGCDYVLLGVIQ